MAIATIVRTAALGFAFLISSSLARAQDSQPLGGPLMGFVPYKTGGVRPVYGVPGAATLGTSVLFSGRLSAFVAAPQGGYALGIAAPDRRVVLLRNHGASLVSVALDFAPGASRIVLSPSGTSAAVYYGQARSLAVITGLPDSASLSWHLGLPDFAGAFAAFAVSDDGSAVLAVAGREEAPLFLMTPDLNYRILSQISGSPSVAFLADSLDAVVVDGALGSVLLVQDLKGEPKMTVIGGHAEGISSPVAVAVGANNRQVFVANGKPGGVINLSLSGGEAKLITCNCTPTLMEPLGGHAVFRLNDAGQGPVWLFDAGGSHQRIVFVPDQSRRMPIRRQPPIRKQIGAEP